MQSNSKTTHTRARKLDYNFLVFPNKVIYYHPFDYLVDVKRFNVHIVIAVTEHHMTKIIMLRITIVYKGEEFDLLVSPTSTLADFRSEVKTILGISQKNTIVFTDEMGTIRALSLPCMRTGDLLYVLCDVNSTLLYSLLAKRQTYALPPVIKDSNKKRKLPFLAPWNVFNDDVIGSCNISIKKTNRSFIFETKPKSTGFYMHTGPWPRTGVHECVITTNFAEKSYIGFARSGTVESYSHRDQDKPPGLLTSARIKSMFKMSANQTTVAIGVILNSDDGTLTLFNQHDATRSKKWCRVSKDLELVFCGYCDDLSAPVQRTEICAQWKSHVALKDNDREL